MPLCLLLLDREALEPPAAHLKSWKDLPGWPVEPSPARPVRSATPLHASATNYCPLASDPAQGTAWPSRLPGDVICMRAARLSNTHGPLSMLTRTELCVDTHAREKARMPPRRPALSLGERSAKPPGCPLIRRIFPLPSVSCRGPVMAKLTPATCFQTGKLAGWQADRQVRPQGELHHGAVAGVKLSGTGNCRRPLPAAYSRTQRRAASHVAPLGRSPTTTCCSDRAAWPPRIRVHLQHRLPRRPATELSALWRCVQD
ncbi:uncharacterized protein PFL1_05387 [Pseudozyma flocculosa PF-1]|uniref:Uncharacterized protein n=1 Tax=Pseudozyma flocculosa PF-1 TaxID=1277687 RepID=A0A061H548_9BASI|nr:uncharacterized protein PFL1_05387 [Pseudozyma flocculosa PF-1]EPQ27105.1 hypothetical protein PFL1_05387 [Pseudozyma flocculosa PF-1]